MEGEASKRKIKLKKVEWIQSKGYKGKKKSQEKNNIVMHLYGKSRWTTSWNVAMAPL